MIRSGAMGKIGKYEWDYTTLETSQSGWSVDIKLPLLLRARCLTWGSTSLSLESSDADEHELRDL